MDIEGLQIWWQSVWVQAGFIIVIAWVIQHFTRIVTTVIVRRTVRQTPLQKLARKDPESEQALRKRQDTLISVISVLAKVIIWATVVYSLIRLFFPHISFAPIFASAGIAGVALGFGAQTLVRDFLAGVFIIIENQYRVGDYIEIDGSSGTVEKITLRMTMMRDMDGNVHYLSNGNIVHAINMTMDYGKIYFTVTVHPSTDLDTLTEIINDVGQKLAKDKDWKDKILDPPHFFNLGSFSDTALEANVIGNTKAAAQWAVTSEMKKRLIRELARNNIELSQYTPIRLPKKDEL